MRARQCRLSAMIKFVSGFANARIAIACLRLRARKGLQITYVLAHIVESRCRSFYQIFRRVSFFAGLTCHFRDSKNRLIDRKIAISKPEEEDFAIGSSTLYFRYDDIKRAASADTPYARSAFNPGTHANVKREF